MQVILLEKIRGLGNLGEAVKVKPGYGRNYLIPQHKAVPATAQNMAKIEAKRAELEKAAAAALQSAQERAAKLQDLVIEMAVKAGEGGKLFGSVGARDIAALITEKAIAVDRKEIQLPEGALRLIGDYEIKVALHSDVHAIVKLNVIAQA